MIYVIVTLILKYPSLVYSKSGQMPGLTLTKHKVIVSSEAIEEKWQESCEAGEKKTHPVEYGLERNPNPIQKKGCV